MKKERGRHMQKSMKDEYFPIRHDAEDEIFIICMSEFKEFPKYITKLDDIVGKYNSRYVSASYKNLNLDSVLERKDKSLINIEHHTNITPDLMRRDYEYCISVHAASKRHVKPLIFYTGKLPIKEVEYVNDTMFYNPTWIMTQKIDGNIRLNNLKYKIEKQEPSTVYDILDLIWLPKYRTDLNFADTILICIELWKKINAEEWQLNTAKKCLKLWIGKCIKNKEDLQTIEGGLNMSALELRPFEEQLANVIYTNRLRRAEEKGMEEGMEKGMEEGMEKGERNIITKLLEKNTPEEISSQYNIPLEKIQKIQNSK